MRLGVTEILLVLVLALVVFGGSKLGGVGIVCPLKVQQQAAAAVCFKAIQQMITQMGNVAVSGWCPVIQNQKRTGGQFFRQAAQSTTFRRKMASQPCGFFRQDTALRKFCASQGKI